MAKRFAVEEEVFEKYRKAARDALLYNIRPKIIQKLKDNIGATVYSSPDPQYYARTHSMQRSVSGYIKTDNSTQTIISIYPDPNNMTGFPVSRFKNYASIAGMGSSDNREMIVEWLNEGTSGSPIYNHKPHKFMDKTAKESSDITRKELGKALSKANRVK